MSRLKTDAAFRFTERPRLSHELDVPKTAILLPRLTNPSRSAPDSRHSVGPTGGPRAASHEWLHRSYRNTHIRLLRSVTGPGRSNPTIDDRLSTSTSTILWYKHWPPCPRDPASLRRRVRGYMLQLPAPGPPALRAARAICLDTILLFFCPLLRTSPPLLSLLFLIRQSTIERVCAINLLDYQHA